MSRIPAAIENVPKVVNSDMNALPALSAMSIASAFDGRGLEAEGRHDRLQCADDLRPSARRAASPLPRFEDLRSFTATPACRRGGSASQKQEAASPSLPRSMAPLKRAT